MNSKFNFVIDFYNFVVKHAAYDIQSCLLNREYIRSRKQSKLQEKWREINFIEFELSPRRKLPEKNLAISPKLKKEIVFVK